MKILLAVDGSPTSDAAVAEVCRRPWPPETQVRLIIADPPLNPNLLSGSAASVFDEVVARQRAEAHRCLNEAAATVRRDAPQLHVTPVLHEGSPKEVILDEADRWGADLIMLGSHGYGTLRRLFLGSVSHAVATHAPCSVEIVRQRATPAGD